MKRIMCGIMILCLSLTLSQVCQATNNEVSCGSTTSIYANLTKKDTFNVTVLVGDRCSGEDSKVSLRDTQGTELKSINVPDTSISSPTPAGPISGIYVTFVVAPGQSILLECKGSDGRCEYIIVDITKRGKR